MISEELLEARLIKRYKRFLADVQVNGSDSPLTVHCPNPGSMIGVAEPGAKIWLRESTNKKAKLGYAWVLTELPSTIVCVDTLMANRLVFECLKNGQIAELRAYELVEKEKTYKTSRFDFFLSRHKKKSDCFLEVKSTTLAENRVAMFPDAKTERGCKHLKELIECRENGLRAVQFFCIARQDTEAFRPAGHIDEIYAARLKEAAAYGVEILAYPCYIERKGRKFNYSIDCSAKLPLML